MYSLLLFIGKRLKTENALYSLLLYTGKQLRTENALYSVRIIGRLHLQPPSSLCILSYIVCVCVSMPFMLFRTTSMWCKRSGSVLLVRGHKLKFWFLLLSADRNPSVAWTHAVNSSSSSVQTTSSPLLLVVCYHAGWERGNQIVVCQST